MPRKDRYSVQVDFADKKEPTILNRLSRNQYGINMKKLWNNYILKLVEQKRNDKADYFLKFTARKKKRSDEDGRNILRNDQGEDGETDQGGWARDYQQGW
jgi:hypothetical protein